MTTLNPATIEASEQAFRDGDETAHPDMVRFLATLAPDAELGARGDALRALGRQLRHLRSRRDAIASRTGDIDLGLPDADERARRSLLAERAALGAEVASLPAQLATIARRHTLARLAFYRQLWQLASDEKAGIERALAGPIDEQDTLKRALWRDEARRNGQPLLEQGRRRAMVARSQALAAEMRPFVGRRDLADQMATMAMGVARSYGEDVRLMWDSTWEIAADRAARSARMG